MKTFTRLIAVMMFMIASASAFGFTDAPFPTTTNSAGQGPVVITYEPGWNYKGNSFGSGISPTDAFGAFYEGAPRIPGITENVNSVWKWDGVRQKWQVSIPYYSPANLNIYARQNGWCPLTWIQPGEGYWLRASGEFSVTQQQYFDPSFILSNMANGSTHRGWNSMALPLRVTARELVNLASAIPPAPGKIGDGSVVSLWTYHAGDWSFYAPSIDEQGGSAAVAAYAALHGTLPLEVVHEGEGVWMDKNSPSRNYGNVGECESDDPRG